MERCGVSQMEMISPRGGQTAAMALAQSREGAAEPYGHPGEATRLSRQYRHVFHPPRDKVIVYHPYSFD